MRIGLSLKKNVGLILLTENTTLQYPSILSVTPKTSVCDCSYKTFIIQRYVDLITNIMFDAFYFKYF
jgi:hypothetical protein